MAMFKEIVDVASATVRKSGKLVKNNGKIAALKFNNYTAQANIEKLYIKIGKLYYKKHGLAPEAGFEKLCDKVTELQTLINDNDSVITEIKIDGVLDEVVVDPEDMD